MFSELGRIHYVTQNELFFSMDEINYGGTVNIYIVLAFFLSLLMH